MAVSKRLRYEIMRRDNHACRYCGAGAPDAKLTVDHVVPVALGGSDDPSNLVTACSDCNAGKSASSPDAPIVANVAEDALRWSKALAAASERMLAERDARAERLDDFLAAWNRWGVGPEGSKDRRPVALPLDWRDSVDRFLAAGLPLPVLLDAIDTAMGRRQVRPDRKFRYVCGIAWTKIAELQKAAQAMAGGSDPDDTDDAETAARYRWAIELFEALGDAHREHYLGWTADYEHDDGEPYTVEEQTITAVELAINDIVSDTHWLEITVFDLLKVLPDGIGEKALRVARTKIYDQHGTNFTRVMFIARAAMEANREYLLRNATSYLAALPTGERDELARYAISVHGDLDYDEQLIAAARVGRALEDPNLFYQGMCGGPGEHITRCPNLAEYTVWFADGKCCGSEPHCAGHPACERHLERLVEGTATSRVVGDYAEITKEEG